MKLFNPSPQKYIPFLLLVLLILLGSNHLFAAASNSAVVATSPVTTTVNWDTVQRTTTAFSYGMNASEGLRTDTYNLLSYMDGMSKMNAGIIRLHNYGLNGENDPRNWLDFSAQTWDRNRISNAMEAMDRWTDFSGYNPTRLVHIVTWPAWMETYSVTDPANNNAIVSDNLLSPDAYEAFANHSAELVRILNIEQGRGIEYFELLNEQDQDYYIDFLNYNNGNGTAIPDRLDEMIALYNQAARAMKAVDPSIKIIGPAFARPDQIPQVQRFVDGTVNQSNPTTLDGLSIHGYASGDLNDSDEHIFNRVYDPTNPDGGMSGPVEVIRGILDEASPNRRISLWYDEYNISWTWLNNDSRMRTHKGAVFDALAMVYFNDRGADMTAAWNDADGIYGKLDPGNQYALRPSAYLFGLMNAHMIGERVATSTTNEQAIVPYAVKNANGTYAYMLINRSAAPQSVTTAFNGSWSTPTNFTAHQISASGYSTNTVRYADATGGITLPEHSVTMFVVDPFAGSATPTYTTQPTNTPPPTATPFTPVGALPRNNWTASASVSAGDRPASNAIDGILDTQWQTGEDQRPGQWFQVDMLTAQSFNKISMDTGGPNDHPRGYEVYISDDGNNWGSPIASGSGNGRLTTVEFTTETARYIRVVQTGTAEQQWLWWTIAEFNVYGDGVIELPSSTPVIPTHTPTPSTADGALPRTNWVATASVSSWNSNAGNTLDGIIGTQWQTGQDQTPGQWFQVDMLTAQSFNKITMDTGGPNDYPRGYEVYVSDDGNNWGSPVASGSGDGRLTTVEFSVQTARYIRVVQTGSAEWTWWTIDEFNVYGTVISQPTATPTTTFTATPPRAAVELQNGGFEMAGNSEQEAAFWVGKDLEKAGRRVCQTANAHTGSCAFRFNVKKASNGNPRIQQNIEEGLSANDTLVVSGYFKGKKLTEGAQLRVVAVYEDGSEEAVTTISAGTYDYQLLTATLALRASPIRVSIRIETNRSGGTLFVDDVSISTSTSLNELLPLPLP